MHKTNKRRQIDRNEILPEYDFTNAQPNKYAPRYRAGGLAVVLDPDVAKAFPSATAVNDALRALAGLIRKHRAAHRNSEAP
jgi:hypothetical protein